MSSSLPDTYTEYRVVNLDHPNPEQAATSPTREELQAWATWQRLRGEHPQYRWVIERREVEVRISDWKQDPASERPALGEPEGGSSARSRRWRRSYRSAGVALTTLSRRRSSKRHGRSAETIMREH